jgi:hypothetical protein
VRGSVRTRNEEDLGLVQSAVSGVLSPNPRAVSEALGVKLSPTQEEFTDLSSDSLEELDNLDRGEVPALILKRIKVAGQNSPTESKPESLASWDMFLLAWDKTHWRASWLENGFEPFELQIISGLIQGSRQLALVVYAGGAAIPYPAIYQLKDHAASLLWDGRGDESQYQGYAQGRVEFRSPATGSVPQMIVSGRADPGLLHFPKDGKRGFDVQMTYEWDGKNYLPGKTEYVANEDFRIYQFISALHLHDFRSAYALIDAAKFLMTDVPSLQIFRQRIENSWPEFLDDQIFDAQESTTATANTHAFELSEEDKHYVYTPSFGADAKHLLTGLERREEKN